MRRIPASRVIAFVVLSLGASLQLQKPGLAATATAESGTTGAVPRRIRISGVVTGQRGTFASGISRLTFLVYEEPAGGPALWSEVQDVRLDAKKDEDIIRLTRQVQELRNAQAHM